MHPTHDRTWLTVSRSSLIHNYELLSSYCDDSVAVFCVVKANAYGHGIEPVVTTLYEHGARHFAVDSIDEAILAREHAPDATILVMGYIPNEHMGEILKHRLEPVIFNLEQIRLLHDLSPPKPIDVHLKIETGTSRLGVFPSDVKRFIDEISASPHLRLVGFSTHYARAEEVHASEVTKEQTHVFYDTIGGYAESLPDLTFVHSSCSAAIIAHPDAHGTAVRAGISLYGYWSSQEIEMFARKSPRQGLLEPVLRWHTRVAQVKTLPAGATVGYGNKEIVPHPTRIAVLPIGYYDGYTRHLSRRGEVLIRGQRCRILGNVCMNMMMVDASKSPQVKPGDVVTLLGRDGGQAISATELADRSGTIHWEILARISTHHPRYLV